MGAFGRRANAGRRARGPLGRREALVELTRLPGFIARMGQELRSSGCLAGGAIFTRRCRRRSGRAAAGLHRAPPASHSVRDTAFAEDASCVRKSPNIVVNAFVVTYAARLDADRKFQGISSSMRL